MTNPLLLTMWHQNCELSAHLRHIELRLDARGTEGPLTITYTMKKEVDGAIEVTHSLTATDYCPCPEDDAVADTKIGSYGVGNLVRVATMLSRRRKVKLVALAKREDDAEGMFRMPTAMCEHCRKTHLTHVSAG